MNTTWSRPTKYVIGIGLVLLGVFVLYVIRSIIPLLIVAGLIAVIVQPLIQWLHQRGRMSRGLAVALVYLLLAILVPLALLFAIPALVNSLRYFLHLDYQSILQSILEWLRAALMSIKAAQLPIAELDAWVDLTMDGLFAELQQATPSAAPAPLSLTTILGSLNSVLTATFDVAASVVGAVVSRIALLIFTFLASVYISLDAHTYRGAFLRALPAAYQPEIDTLLTRVERLWGAFFRGQLTLMLIIGVASWLGLTVLGVRGALYLGIIAGLLELIPNVGPVIATIPAVIVALLQGSGYLPVSPLVLAGLVILFYILLQQFENNLIVPRVLGGAVELPPLVVMVGVLVGASSAGILGALLATPVIATGREVASYLYRKMLDMDPFPPEKAPTEPVAPGPAGLLQRLRGWLQRLARPRSPATSQPVPSAVPASEKGSESEDHPQNK